MSFDVLTLVIRVLVSISIYLHMLSRPLSCQRLSSLKHRNALMHGALNSWRAIHSEALRTHIIGEH